MPSKGVHVYTYIAVPGVSIELSVPKETITLNALHEFWNGTLEVEARNIDSFFNKKGRFTFKVFHDGNQITEQWIDVNALTGSASGGTMESIAQTPSIFHNDHLVISYGFYEAGKGHDVLPDQHQCYIAVAPQYTTWITDLAPPGSDFENKPFSRLVLPSAHDVGMNSMDSSSALMRRVGGAVVSTLLSDNALLGKIVDRLSGAPIEIIAPNIIYSLSMTQKDTLRDMLRIGARYFEFRPARLHNALIPTGALPDRLYFMHAAIPGMSYESFLQEVLDFLRDHPHEIIVVQLRWDGVPQDCCHPSHEEKQEYLEQALRDHDIVAGNVEDMKHRTISELRRDRKRLIMLDSVDSLSTYTDEGNATLTGDSLVDAFGQVLNRDNQRGKAFTNIQCQATPTNIRDALMLSIKDTGVTTSLLLLTKGICDSKTLPWCRQNLLDKTELDHLVVMMNDWIDGATADVAVDLSRRRLEQ
ncbi:putative phosphatidylinositol-specific phospholipase C [Podospora australis]|uniref:Phosphatidylinositol-specific phospholipase C n=1 Tax=Podospora australis TaxID=1536484 RepID=A0AAN7ANG1_9PEZI|nr:putative phosphatidylinositol-specific phospholipase C [Podospora australis]